MTILYGMQLPLRAPTFRQLEILALTATGLTVGEAAKRLGIARSTVKNTLSELYKRIGAVDCTHALAICVARGYITLRCNESMTVEIPLPPPEE